MAQRILITGSIAYDLLLTYEGSFADALKGKSMEDLSVSFFAPHLERHHGGTGANIAWNLQLLGGDPLLVGTVGTDGGAYVALLEERGVSTKHIEKRKDGITSTAFIGTDSGERQIAFFHPGADNVGTWPDLSEERDEIAWAVVGPRNAMLMMKAVQWCDTAKVPVLFDPGQQVLALSPDELRLAISASSGVICNIYEWELLCEKTGWKEGTVSENAGFLIVTKGENGVMVYEEDGGHHVISCIPDRVVNPTGAGDALRAGVLYGLAQQWDLMDSCRLGASLASFVVEIEGTLLDSLDVEEVWARAKQTYDDQLPDKG